MAGSHNSGTQLFGTASYNSLIVEGHLWLGLTIVEHSCLALANQLVSCKLWKS